jgi:hypothetical protein
MAAFHDLAKAIPVSLPQPFRNDEVERASNRFAAGMPEDAFSARIQRRMTPSRSAAMIASERVSSMAWAISSEKSTMAPGSWQG